MRVQDSGKEDLTGALLVVGFPGQGLVGPIVTAYVIQELDMWPVAALVDDAFPPTMAVDGGTAQAPVQFFASAEKCGPDGKCDKLVVLNMQIPLPPERSHEAADTILQWAAERGISHVVGVEGVDVEQAPDADQDGSVVFGVTGENKMLTLEKLGVDPLPDGVVTSHASALMLAAKAHDLEAAALYASAEKKLDQAAASQTLLIIDPIVPNLNLKSEEFQEKVETHRAEHERRQNDQARQLKDMKRAYEMMYH